MTPAVAAKVPHAGAGAPYFVKLHGVGHMPPLYGLG